MYTNEGLVKHAKAALKLKTVYMWGGILRTVEKQYNLLQTQYGNRAGTGYTDGRWAYLKSLCNKNVYGVDCVGLIKSYYWSGKADGGTGSPKYCTAETPDINAVTMFSRAKVKGKIKDIPETPGLIVYSEKTHHVGIYIGGKQTIESTLGTRGDGVVQRSLDSLWTDFFECPYIDYKKPATSAGLKTVKLVYNARIRSAPRYKSNELGTLTAGTQCVVCVNSKQTDPATKYEYIKLYGRDGWIVTSAY